MTKDGFRQISFRMEEETCDHLTELAKLSNVSKKEYIAASIEADWDKLQGNPKMKEIAEQLNQLSALMANMQGK